MASERTIDFGLWPAFIGTFVGFGLCWLTFVMPCFRENASLKEWSETGDKAFRFEHAEKIKAKEQIGKLTARIVELEELNAIYHRQTTLGEPRTMPMAEDSVIEKLLTQWRGSEEVIFMLPPGYYFPTRDYPKACCK